MILGHVPVHLQHLQARESPANLRGNGRQRVMIESEFCQLWVDNVGIQVPVSHLHKYMYNVIIKQLPMCIENCMQEYQVCNLW